MLTAMSTCRLRRRLRVRRLPPLPYRLLPHNDRERERERYVLPIFSPLNSQSITLRPYIARRPLHSLQKNQGY